MKKLTSYRKEQSLSVNPWLSDSEWKITERGAKLIYKYEAINKVPTKLKIGIDTFDHF